MTDLRWASRRLRSIGGFSLLEVLVAITILALTLGLLWQVLGANARRATVVEQTHHAVMLAESKVAEVAAMDALGPRNESGDYGGGYHWQRRIERIDEVRRVQSAATVVPYRVVVEVTWGMDETRVDGAPRSVVLTTVRLGGLE